VEHPGSGERRAAGQEGEGPSAIPRGFPPQPLGQPGETAWKVCKAN